MFLRVLEMILRIPGILLAISVHEYAHARMAYRLGDDTAERYGRMTLEPWAHIDLMGALMMIVFGFGWARPVPVDIFRLRSPRRDMAKVALAGPVSNLIMAFIFETLRLLVFARFRLAGTSWMYLARILEAAAWVNVGLAFFNLIPIPPLDGSKVLAVYLPDSWDNVWGFLERYGFVILWVLVYVGVVGAIISPLIMAYMGAVQSIAFRLSLLVFPR